MVQELDTSTTNEKTLALIKPDAVSGGHVRSILHAIQGAGFQVCARKELVLTASQAKVFYAEHEGKPFYDGLVKFMTSGPVYAMVLSKTGAIAAWRSLMGPTDTKSAREMAPFSLRAKFGTDGTRNACHGSDSPKSARREILFFFPNVSPAPGSLLNEIEMRRYVKTALEPILTRALTQLCKDKPSAGKLESVQFLAHWLLENNPAKPRVLAPFEGDEDAFLADEEEENEEDALLFEHASAAPSGEAEEVSGEAFTAAQEDEIELMEYEASVLKIQSHYRGFVARKNVTALKQNKVVLVQSHASDEVPGAPVGDADDEMQVTIAATKIQSQFRGMKARNNVKNIKEEHKAASKLQAGFRGMKARSEVRGIRNEQAEAATKVQAGFRGMKARKQVKTLKSEKAA